MTEADSDLTWLPAWAEDMSERMGRLTDAYEDESKQRQRQGRIGLACFATLVLGIIGLSYVVYSIQSDRNARMQERCEQDNAQRAGTLAMGDAIVNAIEKNLPARSSPDAQAQSAAFFAAVRADAHAAFDKNSPARDCG